MKQEELTALAVQRMKEVFPEEDIRESNYIIEDEQAICPADKDYIYFSAPLYFKDGFVDAQMINRLQNEARILSVGVGEGHLERLLHLGLDIPQRNIAITDHPMIHPRIKAKGFREYVFDMTQEWPNLKQKFDYILFPESLNIATLNYEKEICDRFFDEIKSITKLCEEGRLEEIKNSDADFFTDLMEQDVPVVKTRYNIIKQALRNLKTKGEVRISSGIKLPQQPPYMKLKLKKEGTKVTYPEVKLNSQFYIKLE